MCRELTASIAFRLFTLNPHHSRSHSHSHSHSLGGCRPCPVHTVSWPSPGYPLQVLGRQHSVSAGKKVPSSGLSASIPAPSRDFGTSPSHCSFTLTLILSVKCRERRMRADPETSELFLTLILFSFLFLRFSGKQPNTKMSCLWHFISCFAFRSTNISPLLADAIRQASGAPEDMYVHPRVTRVAVPLLSFPGYFFPLTLFLPPLSHPHPVLLSFR
jgi:hypothetical protein